MWSQSITRWGICAWMFVSGCTALKVHVEPVQLPIGAGSGNSLADSQGHKISGGPVESWIGALTKVWAEPASIHSKAIGGHSQQLLGFRRAGRYATHETKKTLKDHASRAKQPPRPGSNNSAQADHASHAKQPPRLGSNNSAQAVNAQPLLSFQIQGKLAAPSVAFASEIAAIVICMVLLACVLSWTVLDSSGDSFLTGDGRALDLDDAPKQSNEDSPISAGSISLKPPLPRTHDDLVDNIDGHDGTWARNYRGADGKYRDALELLYRCGIIPPQEFACSRVRQDHIEECVWIATYMLRQRPLEEWVLLWAEAQVKFEESVLACFTARTDVLDTPELATRGAPSSPPQGSTSPMSPQAGPPPVSQKIAEDLVLRSRDSTGQNLLIMRCREIMAKHKGQQPLMEQECYVQCRGGDIQPLMSQDNGISTQTSHGSLPQDAWYQSQYADPDMHLDPSPRVTLKVFEKVVPSPMGTSSSSLGDAAAGLTRQPSMPMSPTWTLQPAGSSAACSTSAYHTMNPELGEKRRM